jgi:hypothetical protein
MAEGTITPANATETIIGAELTAAGVYTLTLDLTNMIAGNDYIFRAYTKTLTAGAYALAIEGRFTNVQGIKVAVLPPIKSPYALKFTYEAVSGVTFFDWRVDSL